MGTVAFARLSRRRLLAGLALGTATIARPRAFATATGARELADRLIESPLDRSLELCVAAIGDGLSPQALLWSLQTAAARTVSPYPSVGFKFHAVMVPRSLWRAASSFTHRQRWLPLLWGVDYYKRSQRRQVQQGGWELSAAAPGSPDGGARKRLLRAIDDWDLEAAEAARADLGPAVPSQVFRDLLARGLRDYRDIGHKAIHAANCHRLMQFSTSGHQPLLGSLVHALLNHGDDPNPAVNALWRDASWRAAGRLVATGSDGGALPQPRAGTTLAVLQRLRAAEPAAMMRWARGLLAGGAAEGDIWDGLFLAAAEMMLRRPGIIALHANTTANACRYACERSPDDRTRRRMLLQSLALMTHFRVSLGGGTSSDGIDTLDPLPPQSGVEDDVFASLHDDRRLAARRLLGHLRAGYPPGEVIKRARRLLICKAGGVHDYKYLEAAFENLAWISPPWRDRYLISAVFRFKGPDAPDNGTIDRARELLRA